ncbi:MAG: hypothetical protein FJW68_10555, partial [Actinobacteria bacterium]|nr:hypothetical protein [Actinomycetota bacterium]
WIASDFEEIYLRNLIKYRLIKSGKKHADILRQLKIGWGENRYSQVFAKRISFLKEEIEKTSGEPSKNSFFKETLDATLELESIVSRLFKIVPQVKNQMVDMPALCSCCISFLADFVSMPNKEVDYAKQFSYITELKKNLETLKSVMGQSASLEEAISKIMSLIIKIRFKTEGPRPSHLLVNDILSGAIAGRKNVFIVGMDDHKFPGGQFQDPILLDEERDKISGGLLQSKTKLKEKILDFASMLAGIGSGSNISLSYCSFDVRDERLLFPSSLLLQFYRLKELKPDADYSELLNYLKDSLEQKNASASPAAIDQGSWWLNTLLSGENLKDAKPSVFKIYPWLKQGRDALLARAGSSLTVYDGWLGPPENYPDRLKSLDPRKNEDFVLSCTGIETYAQNPYVFFISKILRIERPREIKRDNFMWLDAATRGSLLHDVYEIFLNQIKSIIINGSKSSGDLGDIALQKKMIQNILSDVVEKYKEEIPYPSLSVFKRELNDLKRDVEIFVEENQKLAVPCLLEYQFGYGGKPSVKINIGRGCFINVAGRVDRVDVSVKDDNALYVWDYKTGGTYGYDEDGYVNKGKQFQHVLYSHVIETVLKEKNPLAKVLKCGYLFPTQRGRSGGRGCMIERDPHE